MHTNIGIVVAMEDSNRGVGKGSDQPWPYLTGAVNFKAQTLIWRSHVNKKVMCIWGKNTWINEYESFKNMPNTVNVVISSNYDAEGDPHDVKVCASLTDALEYASSPEIHEDVECIWVLGGERLFEEALVHEKCKCLFLTRIMKEYDADVFFPRFEDKFEMTTLPTVNTAVQTENGIPYKNEVWKKIEM